MYICICIYICIYTCTGILTYLLLPYSSLPDPSRTTLNLRLSGIPALSLPVLSPPLLEGAWDLVSKVISRVIMGVTPFRVLITLLITYLLSPMIL